jgi:hypothetical protein
MRRMVLTAAVVLFAAGGARAADIANNPPTTADICLDVSGATLPVVCRADANRLDHRVDICHCPRGQQVTIAVCGPNEKPPAESLAYDRARLLALRNGSLLGDMYEGQRMCVAPRNSLND